MMSKKSVIQISMVLLFIGMVVWGCGTNTNQEAGAISPPKNLDLSRSPGTVVLSWETSSSSGVAGYYTYRSLTNESTSFTKISNTVITSTTYQDTGLVDKQRYYYAIASLVAGNESALSEIVTAAPITADLPITINNIRR